MITRSVSHVDIASQRNERNSVLFHLNLSLKTQIFDKLLCIEVLDNLNRC